ncbi:hypothetical protein J4455_02510 [Candidatus Woesearchaeota archaeon]|nr:hypothetical protein [Candidatus Woesearchaeota archaeon]
MQRGVLITNSLRLVIVSLVIYILLTFFVIPYSYAGIFEVNTRNIYNLTILLYSFFISLFVNVILFKSDKKRKWFFE